MLANLPGGGLVPCRWGCTMSQGDGVGTQSPTWTTPISEAWTAAHHICFPSYYQVPIDVTAGWATSLFKWADALTTWLSWLTHTRTHIAYRTAISLVHGRILIISILLSDGIQHGVFRQWSVVGNLVDSFINVNNSNNF